MMPGAIWRTIKVVLTVVAGSQMSDSRLGRVVQAGLAAKMV